jgi:hypothetical protein
MPQFWFQCSGTRLCITLDMPDCVVLVGDNVPGSTVKTRAVGGGFCKDC